MNSISERASAESGQLPVRRKGAEGNERAVVKTERGKSIADVLDSLWDGLVDELPEAFERVPLFLGDLGEIPVDRRRLHAAGLDRTALGKSVA
jgi:hypothetical protein